MDKNYNEQFSVTVDNNGVISTSYETAPLINHIISLDPFQWRENIKSHNLVYYLDPIDLDSWDLDDETWNRMCKK